MDKRALMSGQRIKLVDVVPLEAPLAIELGITNACNLKCEFCEHSSERFIQIKKKNIDIEIIKKLIKDAREGGHRFKQVLFTGLGEPLVNTQIVDIVKIIADNNITDKIGIVSNGTLLNPELAERLIDAGLNVLRISLNGLSGEDYKKYTGVSVDFDQMYENIKYFHEKAVEARKRGKDISVYVKIMDYMIADSEEKRSLFGEKFEPISDVINIERLNPAYQDVDYDKFGKKGWNQSKYGETFADNNICQMIFFKMLISPEGDALACCRDFGFIPHQLIMGNLKEENLFDIWNGEKYRQLRHKILTNNVQGTMCDGCLTYKMEANKEDIIDSKREDLISYYENR